MRSCLLILSPDSLPSSASIISPFAEKLSRVLHRLYASLSRFILLPFCFHLSNMKLHTSAVSTAAKLPKRTKTYLLVIQLEEYATRFGFAQSRFRTLKSISDCLAVPSYTSMHSTVRQTHACSTLPQPTV